MRRAHGARYDLVLGGYFKMLGGDYPGIRWNDVMKLTPHPLVARYFNMTIAVVFPVVQRDA